MRQSPFQDAMNNEIGIAANGRSEVSVFIETESEMAEGFGGVAGLLEGAEHQVGEYALLGLAGDFADEALIVLRRNANILGGQRDAHGTFPAVTEGIGATGSGGSGNTAVAHGDLTMMEIFDAQGIAESASQLFELEDLAGI